jgi:hypothetical protein
MSALPHLRIGLLAFVLGASLILGVGGVFADSLRINMLFRPRERNVENAIGQVAEREKAVHAASGNFVMFSDADLERNPSLLGLPWSSFPVKDFLFDARNLESGNIRLRALPRTESVMALAIRARLYIAELSPKGETVHSGWYPEND